MDLTLIRTARQADLISYLLIRGEPLAKEGSRYRHKTHTSLVFTKSTYYWNSQQLHGNPIDFLMMFYGMRFVDAISALTGHIFTLGDCEPFPLYSSNVVHCHDCKRAIAFLTKTRMIDYSIINRLVNTKHISQEPVTNNILFNIFDETGSCVGAEVQGSLSAKRFKGVKANSKYGYGFNLSFSDNRIFNYALFFESPVDLLSFIDLKTLHDKKTLERCILISMSGLKINVVKTLLEVFKSKDNPLQAVMCIDNDRPAENFLKIMDNNGIKYIDCRPSKPFKDYNEQLMAEKSISFIGIQAAKSTI